MPPERRAPLLRALALGRWPEQWLRDFRFSVRSLRRSLGLSVAVIATLTLCIGANTAIFSVLYGLVLKPLPFAQSGQLVEIYNSLPKNGQLKRITSVAQYVDYRKNADLFAGFALWQPWTFNIGEETDPSRGIGARVTADYFKLLGVQPLLGRFYTMDEGVAGRDHVLVLTQSFWESNYRSDPDIVGKVIRLSGEPFTIIGVAPRRMEECNVDATILKPFEWDPSLAQGAYRLAQGGVMYGRLRPGVTPTVGLAQLTALEQRFDHDAAAAGMRDYINRTRFHVELGRVRTEQTKSVRTSLLLLQGGALFVLLLGCVNISSLMLARANGRRAELAIRQALGASRAALAIQLLIESLILAVLGGVGGLAVAGAGLRVINEYTTASIRQIPAIAIDGTVLATTLGVSGAVALAIGLLPMLRSGGGKLLASMQSGARGASASGGMRAISGFLVMAQVALALALLVGAALLISSFAQVLKVDRGFDTARIVHARVALNQTYQGADASRAVVKRIVEKMREIPGVEEVGMTTHLPIYPQFPIFSLPIRGSTLGQQDTYPTGAALGVSPEFFPAAGIRIVEGRNFSAADNQPQSREVFIVDRNFERKYFPHSSAVGQSFGFDAKTPADAGPLIVGVAEVARFNSPDDRSGLPMIYLPILKFMSNSIGGFSMELRTTRSLEDLLPLMRAQMRSVDPALPLYQVETVKELLDGQLNDRRGVMFLLAAFALIALVLSAVGIYGMLAYDVSQRTREIGIRGAIGASRRQILMLILRQGLGRTAIGVGVGLVGAYFLTQFMTSLLYEVRPSDPAAYAVVSLLLLGVAFVASYLPARRAAQVDPIVALRSE